MDKIKLLCTGSCGFILSNFLRKTVYEKKPYNLISLDRINDTLNSMYWNKNHTFYISDVRDPHIINNIFNIEKPDIVIHSAGSSDFSDFNLATTSNLNGTNTIIESCIKHNIKKIIYISSTEIYDENFNSNLDENSNLNPKNLYASMKLSSEIMIKSSKIDYNILRFSNNYGPRQQKNEIIPFTINKILNNEAVSLQDYSNNKKEWTHVYDSCSAIFTVLDNWKSNEVYNVCSNQEYSERYVVSFIKNMLNNPEFYEKTSDLDNKIFINTNKIRSLGWKPSLKFKDGLSQTIDWFLSNKWHLKF